MYLWTQFVVSDSYGVVHKLGSLTLYLTRPLVSLLSVVSRHAFALDEDGFSLFIFEYHLY